MRATCGPRPLAWGHSRRCGRPGPAGAPAGAKSDSTPQCPVWGRTLGSPDGRGAPARPPLHAHSGSDAGKLAGRDDLVDEAVRHRLLRGEDLVALDVGPDL